MRAESPPEKSLSLSDVEEFSVDTVVLTDKSGGPEDVESENDALHLQEKTDLPDPSSTDGTDDASELTVPVKEDHDVSNELEDDEKKVVRG